MTSSCISVFGAYVLWPGLKDKVVAPNVDFMQQASLNLRASLSSRELTWISYNKKTIPMLVPSFVDYHFHSWLRCEKEVRVEWSGRFSSTLDCNDVHINPSNCKGTFVIPDRKLGLCAMGNTIFMTPQHVWMMRNIAWATFIPSMPRGPGPGAIVFQPENKRARNTRKGQKSSGAFFGKVMWKDNRSIHVATGSPWDGPPLTEEFIVFV